MKVATPEKAIQRAIIDWLNTIPAIKCWRQNTGAVTAKYKGRTRFVRYGQPGQSDIGGIISPHGVMLQIEVKRPGNKPTDDQYEWLEMVRRAAGIAFWSDSLESCAAQLRVQFLSRGWPWSASWDVR